MYTIWQIDPKRTPVYVVHVTYNASQGDPGESFYGPFKTKKEAQDFEAHWLEDSQEIEETKTIHINPVTKW